ncbi:response regulator [Periweissella cryptocerci]|uniref:Response regulator n=1 Tax=Periweissella cryptocerci TaxID=2506420 RepID=A0A4P6YUD3_9LACO|nr:LytTR family transcriptional regulator DNA-binding domain-containing protein [Periweissella cryptocerci]QBO36326.1 response regulator [Periweissella cryptocerci]
MQILIVDDEVYARDELRFLLEQNPAVDTVVDVESISEAVVQLFAEEFDAIFIDVQLNEENGFELAQRIPKLSYQPKIVFATAFDEYALQAFDLNATDYILKPFSQARIDKTIAKLTKQAQPEPSKPKRVSENERQTVNPLLPISVDGITLVLNKRDIIWATVSEGELTIHTATQDYQTHENLSWLKERLEDTEFLQVHRGYLVNLAAIVAVEPWFNHTYQLTMNDGTKVPVSRSFVPKMKQQLGLKAL